ncbi:MAG: hypothetical protein AAF228_08730 [Pseudomonadota bacterium]
MSLVNEAGFNYIAELVAKEYQDTMTQKQADVAAINKEQFEFFLANDEAVSLPSESNGYVTNVLPNTDKTDL